MDKFLINGPCRVKGKVLISGSKNASLPILAATLLFDHPVIIKNLPRVKDMNTMLNLLRSLGSKNASLPILAATLLFDKPVVIKNLPRVRDINTMLNLLKSLGSKIILSRDKKTAKIINKKNMKTFASYSLVKTMRGSILVLGPLISKYHKSKISLPGGCLIGARPVNYHLTALKKLGMKYELKDGYILANQKHTVKQK